MILGGRSLRDLSLDEIRGLVDDRVPEDIHLEYKQGAYDHNNRFEMLRDVIALANSEGGYLILGIQEDALGRAEKLLPIDDPHPKAQAMLQRCLENISERIERFDIRVYETGFNQGIIVIRVPSSDRQPHMATLENRTDFFRRYETSKRTMTIAEIRDSILSNPRFRQSISIEPSRGEQPRLAANAVRVTLPTASPRLSQPPLISAAASSSKGDVVTETIGGIEGPPSLELITEHPVEKFLYRYLLGGTTPQVLVIISPYISNLVGGTYKLESVIKRANADRTRLYVITQPPREDYQRASMTLLENYPYVEIRYNSDIHAKLYISWSHKESESFALFGSGNLTEGGMRHNIELGLMIFGRGYGRSLLRELYYWSTNTVRSSSQRVKAIAS
jgi:hypothetical protein